MTKDKEKTKVKFYKEPDGDGGTSILAVFIEKPEGSQGNLLCYAHVGQHSLAHKDYLKRCEPASAEEAQALKEELEGQGYNLVIAN